MRQRGLGLKPKPPVALDPSAPIGHAEVLNSLPADDVKAIRKAQQSLDGRLRDKQLIGKLREQDFSGCLYEMFEAELMRYAISVLRAWMYSGYIFGKLAKRGFALNPTEAELRELATDSEERGKVATMTAVVALAHFRTKALREGGWRAEGGASITTYFMGACLFDFRNEFRRWRVERLRHARAVAQENAELVLELRRVADPVALALANARVREDLEQLDDHKRRVVALHLDGYTHAEIAELLDLTSARAVEGILHRWRKKRQKDLREEGRGDA